MFIALATSALLPSFIGKEFEKEWEIVWEVFSELLDNRRDPAIIPLNNSSTTHTSTSSTTHYSTPFVTPTTISHVHLQSVSCTNITTSNKTPILAKTTLSTIPTISTSSTSFVELVIFPKQLSSNKKNSIKESACVTLRHLPTPTGTTTTPPTKIHALIKYHTCISSILPPSFACHPPIHLP